MRATTACVPQIWCAAAAAGKVDRIYIDLTRRLGLRVYLIDPTSVGCALRACVVSRGARSVAIGARPDSTIYAPPCSRANCSYS